MDQTQDGTRRHDKGEQVSLHTQVTQLPEIYQPLFKHPELSHHTTRGCKDRLVHIEHIYQLLSSHLKRPLRVLDLGCAQGFFSLSLAQCGASVVGIDLQTCNIDVCRTLASENPDFKVEFRQGLIEEIILTMTQDQYDLVLGLSVFHHLVHISGLRLVQTMISVLANATWAGIYEVASAHEPTIRASSQPANTRELLDAYAFVHEMARHPTHLGDNDRPLYIASNRCWFLNGQLGSFHAWRKESHDLSQGSNHGTRRYFFGPGHITKLFTLDDEAFRALNLQEHTNEITFLMQPPADIKPPRLFLCGHHKHEAWLVREMLPGELLLDILRSHKPYDAHTVIQDILDQLTALEKAGLYHDDLRIWNIVIGSDGRAALIDYGAIGKEAKDRGWPYNPLLSFIIVMHEIISGTLVIPDPIRPTLFNPDRFPEPYREGLWRLLERPPQEWRFSFLRECLYTAGLHPPSLPPSTRQSISLLIQTMEDACRIHQSSAHYWRHKNAETKTSATDEGLIEQA